MAHIFISHSDKDHTFIDNLRKSIVLQGLEVWVDNRELRGGAVLTDSLKEAIQSARAFIVVLSPHSRDSQWVITEVQLALTVAKKKGSDYAVIPLLLEGFLLTELTKFFPKERTGIGIEIGPGGISEGMPRILAALGERSQDVIQPMLSTPIAALNELLLHLTEPVMVDIDSTQRPRAKACLSYIPAAETETEHSSQAHFTFTAPIGPIEREELSWYLERYSSWPSGVFRQRAEKNRAEISGVGQGPL